MIDERHAGASTCDRFLRRLRRLLPGGHPTTVLSGLRRDGEDAWERLKADRPDILAEFLADYQARRAAGGPFSARPASGSTPRHGGAAITNIVPGPAGNSKSAGQTAATPAGERGSADSRHETCCP